MSKSILSRLSAILILQAALVLQANGEQAAGAVASAHPLATQAGLEVLEKGGNAFDAAIAVASTLNVVEPAMSGLGGYGSTLIYDARRKEIRYLNASGKFPQAANSDFMRPPTEEHLKNRKGPKSISTPGNLNAWQEMHTRYGKLSWNCLFARAIGYARRGVPVTPIISKVIESSFNEFSAYSKSIYGKDGHPLQEGDILIQQDLGNTYELIAQHGAEPFYYGNLALRIDKQMKELGSFLSIEDLRADVAEWWDPITISYKGYDVYTIGTPGNGFSALFALGVMGQFPLDKLGYHSCKSLHLLIETLKESTRVRLTHSGSVEEKSRIIDHILTQENFASVARRIDLTEASPFNEPSPKEGMDTTHFVVIDQWGNIVSSTQTLGNGFGSKVMIEGTGIWMNNSMAFSTFEPKGNPMDVFPGGYKLSSNSPVIIMKDGAPWAALGTPGGHTIPQNVAQILINLIDFNMGMQDAIDAPKLAFFEEHHVVCTERGVSEETITSLKELGHAVKTGDITPYVGISGQIGNAMGVRIVQSNGETRFDIGVDKRRNALSTQHIERSN
jgi:gamma-glutamyltranspeptidase/glutathione hydrolase